MLIPCAVLAAATTVTAQDARQVVAEAQARSTTKSQRYEGRLQVVDAGGKTSEKRWTYTRLGSHGASKTIIRFTGPAEVKGVALLIVNFPDRASDQWMWTPAINRERRIATQDRRTRFFGTDFSFEDLEERDVDHHTYVMEGEETLEGERCWRIASTPRPGRRSQYTRSTLWIRQSTYSFAQVENFNGSTLVRRLRYRDMASVQGIWSARTLEMHDFTRNSRTILTLESLTYDVPLRDDQFTVQALQRS
ncbi:outer membrane lipoprotein-sorting protein [Luteitalea sp.]|uniref:outer membrane lipoprotein-sorting protein n=1 Tax=Luteitalea sp. TaxID=2004800 RepID=UPI0025C02C6B|nr:outer membrane lipoprotein-sorting protein [Luteitalea sp.]